MNSKGNIVLFNRTDAGITPGGDTVQIYAIAKYLKSINYNVVVTNDLKYDLSDVDTVFIFNLQRPYEAYLQAKAAIQKNIPYIFFPIYWDIDKLNMDEIKSFKSIIKFVLPTKMNSYLRGYRFYKNNKKLVDFLDIINFHKLALFILEHAKFICPNSNAEKIHLIQKFQIEHLESKIFVILNGIDVQALISQKIESINVELPEKFICCIGGIGPRKNQLNLVRAANKTKINLLILGRTSTGAEEYAKKVKEISNKNIHFIDYVDQQTAFYILNRSIGHIQPSYIETPGLASLEAAALGCPIVVSDVPPVKEYFGDFALYCNPSSVNSITDSLLQLSQKTRNNSMSHNFQKNYEWNHILESLKNLLEK
ncbi:glycosyltransferase [Paenibacillus vulneris]